VAGWAVFPLWGKKKFWDKELVVFPGAGGAPLDYKAIKDPGTGGRGGVGLGGREKKKNQPHPTGVGGPLGGHLVGWVPPRGRPPGPIGLGPGGWTGSGGYTLGLFWGTFQKAHLFFLLFTFIWSGGLANKNQVLGGGRVEVFFPLFPFWPFF